MTNPAQLLHETLVRWSGDNQHAAQDSRGLSNLDGLAMTEHRIAMKQLSQIEELLASLAAVGRRVEMYQRNLPQWQAMIMAYPWGWTSAQPPFDKNSLDMLAALVDRLEDFVPSTTEADRTTLTDLVNDVFAVLDEDVSLPADLRRHVWLVANHARACLDEFAKLGDFELQAAIDRLLVAINVVVNEPHTSGKWTTVRERFVYPFIAGSAVAAAHPIFQQAIESAT